MKRILPMGLILAVLFGIGLVGAQESAPSAPSEPAQPETKTQPQPAVGPTEQQRKAAVAPFEKMLKEADRLWKERYKDGGKKALEYARKLYKGNPENFDAAWRLARAAFWVAEQSKDEDVKEKVGYEGYQAALKAQKLNPKRVEGYHWGAAALGQYAKGVGIMKALFKGLGGKFVAMCKKAIAINKRYNSGGPLRSLGRYYYSLPWPKRDLEKSTKLLEEAVRIGPNKLRNHAYLADTYLADDRTEQAIKHYKICAQADPHSDDDYADAIIWKGYCMTKLKELKK